MVLTDRQRGTLLGLAIGNALGAAVEFESPGTFPEVTGYRGGGPHGLGAGEWTDDTGIGVALADSIGNFGWDLDDQAQRYLAWYEKDFREAVLRAVNLGNDADTTGAVCGQLARGVLGRVGDSGRMAGGTGKAGDDRGGPAKADGRQAMSTDDDDLAVVNFKLGETAAASSTLPPWHDAWMRLSAESSEEDRLAVFRAIRDSGYLSDEEGFYIVAWHIETMADSEAVTKLQDLDNRMKAIEKACDSEEGERRPDGQVAAGVRRTVASDPGCLG